MCSTGAWKTFFSFSFVISVALQSLAVYLVTNCVTIMHREWTEEFGKDIFKVNTHIVKTKPYWGPVRVLIFKDCSQSDVLDHRSKRFYDDSDWIANEEFCHRKVVNGIWWSLGFGKMDNSSGRHKLSDDAEDGEDSEAAENASTEVARKVHHVHHASANEAQPLEDSNSVKEKTSVEEKASEKASQEENTSLATPMRSTISEATQLDKLPQLRARALSKVKALNLSNFSTENLTNQITHQLTKDLFPHNEENPLVKLDLPCSHGQLVFGHIDYWDRYISMIAVSNVALMLGENSSEQGFFYERTQAFKSMTFQLGWCLFIKYFAKLRSLITLVMDTPKSLGSRTLFDRNLENILVHIITSVFTIGLQVSLCTIFVMVWRPHHAVLSYLPLFEYRCFFWTFVAMTVLNELDKLLNWSPRHCSYTGNIVFWIVWSLIILVMTIPILVTTAWKIQFLYHVHNCSWDDEDAHLISSDFTRAYLQSQGACILFILTALLEQFVFFVMDWHSLRRSSVPVAPEAVRGNTYEKLLCT